MDACERGCRHRDAPRRMALPNHELYGSHGKMFSAAPWWRGERAPGVLHQGVRPEPVPLRGRARPLPGALPAHAARASPRGPAPAVSDREGERLADYRMAVVGGADLLRRTKPTDRFVSELGHLFRLASKMTSIVRPSRLIRVTPLHYFHRLARACRSGRRYR